eukprot:CAMPEP_0202882744 /NCGR_PEP_ID=MMETSP1391-20130828/38461_1 /ASSEMBLY_ACC=CAM_ASM_000867 /TAXON_ID=1034604 /ORGANISM="Chlamydomonas leiostraca, Strain SAG 11-49" /LENGTH=249 /DNA_ID=CAMNT_0049565659 /DNA_START=34 /DNA_END=784 /DNA_ORIENTATION=-
MASQPELAGDGGGDADTSLPGALQPQVSSMAPLTLDSALGPGAAPSSDPLGLARLTAPAPRAPGVRALLPLPSGLLLTGSSDRGIRCWDGARPEGCYLVAGPLWPGHVSLSEPTNGPPGAPPGLAVPQYRYSYSSSLVGEVPVVEEKCTLEGVARMSESSQELRQKMRVHDQCHADALTHMVVAEGVAGGKILITASRDGNVKDGSSARRCAGIAGVGWWLWHEGFATAKPKSFGEDDVRVLAMVEARC